MKSYKDDINENGYLHIKNIYQESEIVQLIKAVDDILDSKLYEKDFVQTDNSGKIHKVRYMFEKGELFRKALVNNKLIELLSEITDDVTKIVPTWEDILIKEAHAGVPVGVHQDLALQAVKFNTYSLGIYFHSSKENPVYYLPGSQKLGALTKDEISKLFHERKHEFKPVFAEPGDVIIHNVKTVHYSDKNLSPTPRYTWYLEFRTLDSLLYDSPWDKDWLLSRRALWAEAINKYAPKYKNLVPDYKYLEEYIANQNYRNEHINDKINYNPDNPYNHFA